MKDTKQPQLDKDEQVLTWSGVVPHHTFAPDWGSGSIKFYNEEEAQKFVVWLKAVSRQHEKELALAKEEGAREAENKAWLEMRKRCLLFGCVFGIPMIDKEPKKVCMFCGQPGYIDQKTWVNISPHESMQKAINTLVKKYKTPEAIQKYLDQLTNPSVKEE